MIASLAISRYLTPRVPKTIAEYPEAAKLIATDQS
jgi:hypothetical protein